MVQSITKDENEKFKFEGLLTGRTEIDTVSKLNLGKIWSATGAKFVGSGAAVTGVEPEGHIQVDANRTLICPVELPNGVTVTKAKIWGDNTGLTWTLYRCPIGDANVEAMASAVHGTEDTTITEPVIDNNTYRYFFHSGTLTSGDKLWGARITYTT